MNKFKNLRGCVDKVSTPSGLRNKCDLNCGTEIEILVGMNKRAFSLVPREYPKKLFVPTKKLFVPNSTQKALIKGQIRPKANCRIRS